MATSQQWWDKVKIDQEELEYWLSRQYRGEMSAARRIFLVRDKFADEMSQSQFESLGTIGRQEATHAGWVRDLLLNRGIKIDADADNAENRYWSTVDLSLTDFLTTMAVGAHAERMRLDRIRAIANDQTAPWDIREVFMKIEVDETFHATFFEEAAGTIAMLRTKDDHEAGKKLLGLEA